MAKHHTSLFVAVPLLSLITAGFAACSSNKPPPPATPAPDSGAPMMEGGAPIGAPMVDGGAPVATATGPTFFTNQDAGGPAPTASGTPTTAPTAPVLTDQALDAAIDLAITAASPKAAPKMNKDSQPTGRATLKEGEHFAMVVTLQPNTCYTFIAFSPPGQVAQVDMKLMGVALAVEAGKSSPPDKALPGLSVMGKGNVPICPVLPLAVPYKVDVVATKGAGRMGVAAFSRPK